MSKTVLFQGDSITDCERPRNSFGGMESGNPCLVKAEVSKSIAAKYGLPLIDLQAVFDNALKTAPASYRSEDGVHPTVYGNALIKDLWIDTFKKL